MCLLECKRTTAAIEVDDGSVGSGCQKATVVALLIDARTLRELLGCLRHRHGSAGHIYRWDVKDVGLTFVEPQNRKNCADHGCDQRRHEDPTITIGTFQSLERVFAVQFKIIMGYSKVFQMVSHAIHAVSASPAEGGMIGDFKEGDCNGPTAFGTRVFWLDQQGRSTYSSLGQFANGVLGFR